MERTISLWSVDRWEKADVVYLGATGSDDTNHRTIRNNGARNAMRRAKVGRRGFCSLRAKRRAAGGRPASSASRKSRADRDARPAFRSIVSTATG